MGDVYDFNTRKNFKTMAIQDYDKNDETAMNSGKYVGCLSQQQAKSILNIMSLMTAKKSQIDALMIEYYALQTAFNSKAVDSMLSLNAKTNEVIFDPETNELYVDVKGHCWVVKFEDLRK